jgi:hypothetical protein
MKKLAMFAAGLGLAIAPVVAEAQMPAPAPALGAVNGAHRSFTLHAGGFSYDQAEGYRAPMLGARLNWALSPVVVTEVGASVARVDASRISPIQATGVENRDLATLSVGVQAQAPLPYVQPYVGISTGLITQVDRPSGESTVRPTTAFPVGVRVPLSQHVGVRGELRYRFDDLAGVNRANREATLGVSVNW